MIPFRLEHVIEACSALREDEAAAARRRTLRRLTGERISRREAAQAWERIMDHKWYVSERLGRDIGLRVAAVDYFDNIAPPARRARPRSTGGIPAPLPMMRPLFAEAR